MHDPSGNEPCSYHPDVMTGLGCGKCGRYICPKCMVHTPVGARCQDCASVAKHPTYDIKTLHYVRAIFAGAVSSVVGGFIWGLIAANLAFTGLLLGIGMGYLIGEVISLASNRKRGTSLCIIAAVCMVVAGLMSGFIWHWFGLLIIVLGGYVAVTRVR